MQRCSWKQILGCRVTDGAVVHASQKIDVPHRPLKREERRQAAPGWIGSYERSGSDNKSQ